MKGGKEGGGRGGRVKRRVWEGAKTVGTAKEGREEGEKGKRRGWENGVTGGGGEGMGRRRKEGSEGREEGIGKEGKGNEGPSP